ncbi:hypothetical protein PA257_1496 [Pseudomonas aeruginosa]|nr:hypothetical protein CSB91_5707 [Pseudomonas aeruginosa]AWF62519.1 hypothetical protein CSC30_4839 [Pseudomonas aeruginosa]KJJ20826.1 hypothetical protein HMPREF3150_01411 [Pseudomonas aeruginosa]PRW26725.1 hypothetical protein CSB96_0455 [Pseudomonas aeruginosa]RCH02115.1 hypothetical protein CSC36_0126 [Pseudomonas aeruginosa]
MQFLLPEGLIRLFRSAHKAAVSVGRVLRPEKTRRTEQDEEGFYA